MYVFKLDKLKVNTSLFVVFTEEYTKITTPRQDVLFKKGYLAKKKPVVAPATSNTDTAKTADASANGNCKVEATTSIENGGEYHKVSCWNLSIFVIKMSVI